MNAVTEYTEAAALLLKLANTVGTEHISLAESAGRVLAEPLVAPENVPPFDRSPYDGYAFCAEDTQAASKENPCVLEVTEEIAAGAIPQFSITPGKAAKILTGAPIPEGADAVIMFEETEFTETTVSIFAPAKSGSNIVRAGEDVRKGQLLAEPGTVIDAGLAGTFASLGLSEVAVYKKPVVGIISTGNEVTEIDVPLPAGGIYNSNRYVLDTVLTETGCTAKYFGKAKDDVTDIAESITAALEECDAVLLTGGVSVGDYDLTPAAMEQIGAEILVQGVKIKPGMACAYAVKDGKLICGLSGNPASSITNFYVSVLPAVRKLCGRKDPEHKLFDVEIAEGFGKKSKVTRLLRGKLDLTDGRVKMHLPQDQGNVIISSMIGCDVFAIVPAGSGKLEAGMVFKGFMV